jgi:hypothetical protein
MSTRPLTRGGCDFDSGRAGGEIKPKVRSFESDIAHDCADLTDREAASGWGRSRP